MRVIVRFRAIALGLAITVTGCASPPNAEMDATKAALDRPATERAGQYAAESLTAAPDAGAALDAELKAQEGKWFKSYGKAKELAVTARRCLLPCEADRDGDDNQHGHAVQESRRVLPLPNGVKRGLIGQWN